MPGSPYRDGMEEPAVTQYQLEVDTATSDAEGFLDTKAPGLTLLTIVAIVYGSLFPFHFHKAPGNPCLTLLATWRTFHGWADAASNVLLYFPLGFLAFRAYRASLRPAVIPVFAGSTLLSICIELSQFYDASRDTEMSDVYANAFGAALGIMAAKATTAGFFPGKARSLSARLNIHANAILLLCFWSVYELFPYVFSFSFHNYGQAVNRLLLVSATPISVWYRDVTTWLTLGIVMEDIFGVAWTLPALPALLVLIWAARAIFPVALSEIHAGPGILACALWGFLLSRLCHRALIAAMLLCGLLALDAFHAGDFTHGSLQADLRLVSYKAFVCGALVWLLARAGLSWHRAIWLTTPAVLCLSCSAAYATGHVPNLTDTVILLVTAFVMKPAAPAPGQAC